MIIKTVLGFKIVKTIKGRFLVERANGRIAHNCGSAQDAERWVCKQTL
jgi:hypothetical protein